MNLFYKLLASYTFVLISGAIFLNYSIQKEITDATILGILAYLPAILFSFWSIFRK